jgi:hypothetical protein
VAGYRKWPVAAELAPEHSVNNELNQLLPHHIRLVVVRKQQHERDRPTAGRVYPSLLPLKIGRDSNAGTELLTFTVITTDPNEVIQPMHDRMPVIMPQKDYDRWLSADPDRPPIDLSRPSMPRR